MYEQALQKNQHIPTSLSGAAQVGMNAASPLKTEQTDVSCALEALAGVGERLASLVGQLEQSLAPVLREMPEEKTNPCIITASTGLGRAIISNISNAMMIDNSRSKLAALLERLEV